MAFTNLDKNVQIKWKNNTQTIVNCYTSIWLLASSYFIVITIVSINLNTNSEFHANATTLLAPNNNAYLVLVVRMVFYHSSVLKTLR